MNTTYSHGRRAIFWIGFCFGAVALIAGCNSNSTKHQAAAPPPTTRSTTPKTPIGTLPRLTAAPTPPPTYKNVIEPASLARIIERQSADRGQPLTGLECPEDETIEPDSDYICVAPNGTQIQVTITDSKGHFTWYLLYGPTATPSPTRTPNPIPKPTPEVTVKVWGSAPVGVDVNYGSDSDSRHGLATLPQQETLTFDDSANYYNVTAQLQGSGDIYCSITISGGDVSDGTDYVSKTGHASGDYNICSAQLNNLGVLGGWAG